MSKRLIAQRLVNYRTGPVPTEGIVGVMHPLPRRERIGGVLEFYDRAASAVGRGVAHDRVTPCERSRTESAWPPNVLSEDRG